MVDEKGRSAAHALARWFAVHGRDLPWRRDHDAYHILVAEFVLQQTRMEVGLPRLARFLRRFPNIHALAAATADDVMTEWSGLGYYARARNLHATARSIVARHGGKVPVDAGALRALPGIGPYTAGAIASVAYDQPVPSIDGNQRRVLARFLGSSMSIERFAASMLAHGSPRVLNQAIMDLGATVCTPRAPRCDRCPLIKECQTRGEGASAARRRPTTKRVEAYEALRFERDGAVWLLRPAGRGLLGSHWLPPLRRVKAVPAHALRHVFSHKEWRVHVVAERGKPMGDGAWVRVEDLSRLPHGPLTRQVVGGPAFVTANGASRRRRAPSAARAAP